MPQGLVINILNIYEQQELIVINILNILNIVKQPELLVISILNILNIPLLYNYIYIIYGIEIRFLQPLLHVIRYRTLLSASNSLSL